MNPNVINSGNQNFVNENYGTIYQNIVDKDDELLLSRLKEIEKKLDLVINVMEINEQWKKK
jgi:hypothetical protein